MKANKDFQELFQTAIAPHDNEVNRLAYRERRIARAEVVNDIDKRYRWDLFWFANRLADSALTEAFGDLSMEHVDTVLRKIVKPL